MSTNINVVSVSESVGSSAVVDNSELREYMQRICGFSFYRCLVNLDVLHPYTSVLQLPQRMVFPTLLASLQRTQLAMEPSVMSLTSQMNYVSFTAIQSNVIHGSRSTDFQ